MKSLSFYKVYMNVKFFMKLTLFKELSMIDNIDL